MKKYIYILLLLPIAFCGCSNGAPGDVLSVDEMAEILAEMQVAHAGVDLTVEQKDGKLTETQELNVAILDAKNIDPDKFFYSYEYYQQTPRLMDSIYVRILADLEVQVDSLLKVESAGNYPVVEKSKE